MDPVEYRVDFGTNPALEKPTVYKGEERQILLTCYEVQVRERFFPHNSLKESNEAVTFE